MNRTYLLLNGTVSDRSLFGISFCEADGSYLYDCLGRKYLDLRSGLWNTSLGYDSKLYKEISDEFSELMNRKLPYLDINSFDQGVYGELADNIIHFVGNKMEKCMFTGSGSENTDLALKIIGAIRGKNLSILAFKNSYHGSFFGGMTVSGIDRDVNSSMGKPYKNVHFIDFPENHDDETNILHWLKENLGCYDLFFIEPVLASAGVRVASSNFFDDALSIAASSGTYTVFDEVATGFYRTGTAVFADKLTNNPDIICLSKGINNGINPFGSVCISGELYKEFKNKRIHHYSTQNGNLLSVSSANAVVRHYIKNKSQIQEKVEEIYQILVDSALKYKSLKFRAIGAMLAIELGHQDPFEICLALKNLGVLVYWHTRPANGITILPQYNVCLTELEKALKVVLSKAM